jgi:hypothetical protein
MKIIMKAGNKMAKMNGENIENEIIEIIKEISMAK